MNLRRWITALAVLAVFTTLATAQITPASQITCVVSAATAPNIRTEGITERVGDVKLTCTGGLAPVSGSQADRATFVVDYGVAISSKLDTTSGNTTASEIAIIVDEPGSLSDTAGTALGIKGYGPDSAVSPCVYSGNLDTLAHAQANCLAYAELTGSGYWVASSSTAIPPATLPFAAPATATAAQNAYQGVVGNGVATNSKVTFNNVPLIPPVAAGVQRVYRVVNVRVTAATAGTVTATVSATPAVNNVSTLSAAGSAAVATAQASLTTAVTTSALSACVTTNLAPSGSNASATMALLKFNQSFAGAFKTRSVALDATANFGYTATASQDLAATESYVIGTSTVANNSESGVFVNFGGSLTAAGIASSGTRLKAVFNNLDKNVTTYYVSVGPVASASANLTTPTGFVVGDTNSIAYAVAQDVGTGNTAFTNDFTTYTATTAGTLLANNVAGATGVTVVPIKTATSSSGVVSGEVVWEVTNMKPSAADTLTFALYAVYGSGAPPSTTNTATVALGYAPTSGSTSSTTATWIPRYTAIASGVSVLSVLPCQTTLLFPFVTNQSATATTHWETGVAISNTGSDPLGTIGTSGTCTLNFYGTNAPPAITTAAIAPGSGYTFVVSNPANASPAPTYSSFTGYLFAVCNFNYAHGFAFVEDDTRSMAMGYLGLVLNDQTSFRGTFTVGETLAH